MVEKQKLLAIGAGSLILIPAMISTIISYIILYRVLTISQVAVKDPKVRDTLELLKKCALGAFICALLRTTQLKMVVILPVMILNLIMTISILKLSDSQVAEHPDLPFLKKMSLIYVICLGISVGMGLIGGGGYLYYKKMMDHH
jgi:hypothetical protein